MSPIVLVDDEPAILELLSDLIDDAGYDTITAINGSEGLSLARKHHPFLLMTDITMPVMDGFAMLKAIRADPQIAHIPVILMSANAEVPQASIDNTQTFFLPKPFELSHLNYLLQLVPAIQVKNSSF